MSNPFRLFMQKKILSTFFILFFSTNGYAVLPETNPIYNTDDNPTSSVPLADRNYAALRDALPRYEEATLHPWTSIPDGLYKMHSKGSAILLLRARLLTSGDLPPYANSTSNRFDPQLYQAVKLFQERHGLKDDGIVGENTLKELNVTPEERVNQIEVNMKRWAVLAPQLSNRFVMVNVPDFRLHVYDNNEEVLTLKAVVGKTDHQTPELSSRITRLVFNPPWNIPDKIAKKEMAPKMLDDPNYLNDEHIRIYATDEDDSPQISPDEVNWEDAAENGLPYHLRQDPGIDNALGIVKFEFQNSANVYLHDTPAKNLFAEEVRTFSHGCIRLENPLALVDYLMQPDADWSQDRMQSIIDSRRTTYVRAARPTPIFITYITAWVDDNGRINFRDDVYGRDHGEDQSQNQDQDQIDQ